MAHLNPAEAFDHLQKSVLEGIKSHFPVTGRLQTLTLDSLELKDDLHHDDLRSQHAAKVGGETWAVPVFAKLTLTDNATGKIIDARSIRIAEIPKTTNRYSYIVGGQEYQVDSQWQLKPGVYTKRRRNGELETRFNVSNKPSFDLTFDPASKKFVFDHGRSKLPLYPIMKTMGVSDEQMEKAWGKEIYEANRDARKVNTTLESFYKSTKKVPAPSKEEAAEHLFATLSDSKLRADSTAITLGKPFDHVDGEALRIATEKMLKVHHGGPEDDRDSLVFKDLRTVGDYAQDMLRNSLQRIKAKSQRQVNTATNVRDIVKFDLFNEPLKNVFNKNAAANPAKQINPVEMVSGAMQTTVMGSGGIQSERQVNDETKFVNPSHLGFLDPINTPEGCFDEETEVFTKTGWKLWLNVSSEDFFACRVDGRLEFHQATELQKYEYAGTMYGVEKPWLSYLVTPNHRVLCRPYASPGESELRVERADYAHGRPRLFPIAHAPMRGTEQSHFELPFVAGNNSSKNVERLDLKDWASFMGWFLSEGAVTYDEARSAYQVKLFQSWPINAENCIQIEALLRRLPFAWSFVEREHGRVVFTIGVKQLAHYMQQFGRSHEKWIPEHFFDAPIEAREALLETLMLGDGRQTKTHKNSRQDSETYTTTSERLALDVERLAISLGHATSVKKYDDKREERYHSVFDVCLLRDKERSALPKQGHYYTKEYKGMVYCATVPGSFLYVRRNKKHPLWSGNSKTGVTLRLPMGVKKVGKVPVIPLYNLKTGKTEDVDPVTFMKSNILLPDQVTWDGNKPKPVSKVVKFAGKNNRMEEGKFEEAHYVMRHSSQLFNMTSNLIPFLGNTSGNRAGMAARHIEQSISLVNRTAPLVQVSTGVPGVESFERVLGMQSSHFTPIAGTVTRIEKDGIHVKGDDGKTHEVQIYNHYPLTDAKSVMHSTPLVAVGDKVKAGQTVADTNYSKNGTLALGTNLRVAYIPFKGYNFEDGIVISQSAADKLSSMHLAKPGLRLDDKMVLSRRKFEIEHPGIYTRTQLAKLDDGGVIRVGQRVSNGDPLIAATKPFQLKDRTGLGAIRRSMSGSHTDKSVPWVSDFEGEVVSVHKSGDKIAVHVKTVEPMQVGDKMAGRYGNKGIVTMILDDKDMPHTKDGKHVEVALNPSGIPGRMNVGQVLEVAAGKIAEKTGKTYYVKNFDYGVDQVAKVTAELKHHGISDTEELFDPGTNQHLGTAMVGPQHMMKLVHQVEKKLSVRSGMQTPGHHAESYDQNLQPGKGGHEGGQSMGSLGMYALLAHGAKANIREMQTWKSEGPDPTSNKDKQWPSQHHQVWAAIQTGAPLPPPKSTFAFQKFTDMLRGTGVNVEKHGHNYVLSPMTDKHVKQLAPDALPKPAAVLHAKVDKNGDLKPQTGGLFDEKLTGGHQGKKWTRIELVEPMPNPLFENAIQRLTGLDKKAYYAIVGGERAVTPAGHLTALGGGLTGGAAIQQLLSKIDVATELPKAKKDLTAAKGAKLDRALKRVKYLQALDKLGMKPVDAYILHNLPVVPPAMRPVMQLPTGANNYDDLNGLYKEFAEVNENMKKDAFQKHLTDEGRKEARKDYYDGVKAIMGVGVPYANQKQKGILHRIAGASPKTGYFQNILMNRRQDMTMRSTIIPEPSLGLDEVGLPKHAALELFKPFVVKKLVDMGAVKTSIEGPEYIDKKSPAVWHALEKVMVERPVLLKRDPALHKYGVQAFKPRMVTGNAIQIHPLVTGGFNADFDGDTMSIFVPITQEAVREAHKMFPSNNLFMESTGKVAYQPTLESALGVYKLGVIGKDTHHRFAHPGQAVEAVRKGALGITDVVHLDGKKTTTGRILLASILPDAMQKDVLHGTAPLHKGGLEGLLTTLARNHKDDYGNVVNKLKDMGNEATFGSVKLPTLPDGHAFKYETVNGYGVAKTDPKRAVYIPTGTHSLSLEDFVTDRTMRDKVLGLAKKQVESIHANTSIPHADKDRRAIEVWTDADKAMKHLHMKEQAKDPSNLFQMYQAGVKPGWDQYKQMVLAPMLFKDSSDRTLPTPVINSYSEGLDVAGYWNQMPGARRGAVRKVDEVRGPGAMSKSLMNNTMHVLVNDHDCGTNKGIVMSVDDKDVHDRNLAHDFTHGKLHVPSGTMLTPDIVGKIRTAKKDANVVVRSPLKCEDEKGICQQCLGVAPGGHVHDLGTNIGVIASHALGERGVQLALKSFHTGGVAETGGGSKLLNSFERFEQLMNLPKAIPNQAVLAMRSGKIEKVERDSTGTKIWVGGEMHHVGKDLNGMPLHEHLPNAKRGGEYQSWKSPIVGAHIEAGYHLSDPNRTIVNPRDLFEATGSMEEFQNHLAKEVHKLYDGEDVRRRHVEVVVKAMSNLTKVTDPGDHPTVLRGEYRPLSSIRKMNAELEKKGLSPIEHKSQIMGVDTLPLALQEDWMAKLQHRHLRSTLMEAASAGQSSSIHGNHPVPSMAFGAELGVTSKDSLKPGFGHLSDVKDHHY